MLPTSAIVAEVLRGPDGVLAGLSKGCIVVEMSSGVPAVTQALEAEVVAAGGFLVDAPVSGGVARAVAGTLSLMVGGAFGPVEYAETMALKDMGTPVLRTGGVGTGHAMKALNNFLGASAYTTAVEALAIGKEFADPRVTLNVVPTPRPAAASTPRSC